MKRFASLLLALTMIVSGLMVNPVKTEAASKYTTFGNARVKENGVIGLTGGDIWESGIYQLNSALNFRNKVTVSFETRIEESGRGYNGAGAGDGVWVMFSEKAVTDDNMASHGWFSTSTLNTLCSFNTHTTDGWCSNISGKHLDLTEGLACQEASHSTQESNIDDGEWHKVKIVISGGNDVTVFYDNEERLSLTLNKKMEKAYLAFGGYSGHLAAYQEVKNISVTSETVKLSDKSITLNQGDVFYLDYAYSGSSSAKVKFTSSKTSVAKVHSTNGKIVAVNPGYTSIKVKVGGAKATCKVIVIPQKVAGLKKVSATKTNIKLSWTKQTGVGGYEVWMYDRDLEEYTKIKNVDKSFNSATISGLKKGTSYKFYVRSYIKVGTKKYYSEMSKVLAVKTAK